MVHFLSKLLIWTGIFLIAGGIILHMGVDISWISKWLGKLPGDMVIKKGNVKVYFPLASALIFSLVFSIILSLLSSSPKK